MPYFLPARKGGNSYDIIFVGRQQDDSATLNCCFCPSVCLSVRPSSIVSRQRHVVKILEPTSSGIALLLFFLAALARFQGKCRSAKDKGQC